ncbi:MAG: proline dehydrogenase family protein [Bacteroidota bacterium]|nr:proline dehydrogenase family protein [Bacteroidota bacterium]
MDFNNLETAYASRSDKNLNRAYFLFKTINSKWITNILIYLLKLALKLRLPITKIIELTVYNHFCGGSSIKKSEHTIKKLERFNIGTILDFSVEGQKKDKDFQNCIEEILKCIEYAKNKSTIPFCVFKLTGISETKILMEFNNNLIDSKNEKFKKIIRRVNSICQKAYDCNTPIFIDAEESWIQDPIDFIALEMMKKYNQEKVIVYNTIQFYRKDRIEYLNKLIKEQDNYKLGIKLVRGAYHSQEIERAKKTNNIIPVYENKCQTDANYNKALNICLDNINQISICLGTHNEKSILALIDLMKKHNLKKKDDRISFSQLYGMSDHITYNLSENGYNVTKYVPYGPVKKVIPYLIRRANENVSMTGQMGRELSNIIKEKRRRKIYT